MTWYIRITWLNHYDVTVTCIKPLQVALFFVAGATLETAWCIASGQSGRRREEADASPATKLRRKVLIYFVVFAADEPLEAWALIVRGRYVDGRVPEHLFWLAVAGALSLCALLKALYIAQEQGNTDTNGAAPELREMALQGTIDEEAPASGVATSETRHGCATLAWTLTRNFAHLASDALDALLGFALAAAVGGLLRPARSHPLRVFVFIAVNLAVVVVTAKRLKQRVERQVKLTARSAHVYSSFHRRLLTMRSSSSGEVREVEVEVKSCSSVDEATPLVKNIAVLCPPPVEVHDP